jgi:putative tryptophan/tyrosine transport system substrate-binding protein
MQSATKASYGIPFGVTSMEERMAIDIGRRAFVALIGGTVASRPIAAHAQQTGGMRRIGVLMGLANDAEAQARAKAFENGLEKEGWDLGQNVRIEYRFAAGDAKRMHTFANELIALEPDVILAHSTPVVAALLQVTRTIPIVFAVVADPVGSGFATSIRQPGGNVTGFTSLDATIGAKMLTILKQITPNLTRVALMFSPEMDANSGLFFLPPFEAAVRFFAGEPIAVKVCDPAEIESSMARLGREPGVGLIVMADNFTTVHRDVIISLAARYRLPAVYPYRYFADGGGLISYGIDVIDLFRRASSYVDRILKGEKPGELPIQAPTKFELVINLRTAKALNLTVPRILLAGANALIE